MKNVVLRGPVLTQSGYGVHCRQIAQWLLNQNNINVKFLATPWGNTPWILDENAHSGLINEIMKRSTSTPGPCDVSLQLQLPSEWDPKLATFNIGVTAGVETDKCNPEWINACNAMNMVIVPSTHTKQCLINTGNITSPIIVVPESYACACALPDDKLCQLPDFSTSFNFLLFGQLTGNNAQNDRKNTFFSVKWLCDLFKDDPDVGIIIKTNMGRNSIIDKNTVTNLLKQLLAETRKGPFPRFHLLHGDMTDVEIASIYRHRQVKALVALTRGEGYGLPILEAAASGLPIIATGWSGHMDFLKHGKFISTYYKLEDVHKSRIDNKIFMKGARWANPSEEDAKKRLLKFRQSPDTPKQWAQDLRSKILELYSHEEISKQYSSVLAEVLC